jgi:hypothetical protein
MFNNSGDENHLCRTSLRRSYQISSKDHAHGIGYHQRHGAGTPGDYSSTDVSQSDSFTSLGIS